MMREAIPNGQYESLWSWIETSCSKKLTDHELQRVLYPEDRVILNPATGPEAQRHPNLCTGSVRSPEAFVGVLPEGRVWVSENRTIAVIAPDNKLVWDVSTQYHLPNATHPVFHKTDLPQANYMAETVAVLTYVFDSNYYHWYAEVLARIHLLEQSGIPIDKYLIHGANSFAFQAETLALLGIPEHKVIRSQRGMHLKAKRLVIPSLEMYSFLPFIPNFPAKWAVDYFRSKLLSQVQQVPIPGYERIYISRSDAKYRFVTNEEHITAVLKAKGFQVVVLGQMPVADQIRMFASAEFIVAPHGAALTNLMFCRPGTRLLELFSPNYVNPLYWYMSSLVGMDYYYLIGQGEQLPISSGIADVGYFKEHITVEPKAFPKMLHCMGIWESPDNGEESGAIG